MGLALILTFSPWEKERPSGAAGLADECPANPVAGSSREAAEPFSLSLEERGGVRTSLWRRARKAQHPKNEMRTFRLLKRADELTNGAASG
jgi:hypothetical protein